MDDILGLSRIKLAIYGGIILIVLGYVGYKWYDYTSEISNLNKKITDLNTEAVELKAKNILLEADNLNLLTKIKETNVAIAKVSGDLETSKKNYEYWKKLASSQKYDFTNQLNSITNSNDDALTKIRKSHNLIMKEYPYEKL